MQWSRAGKCEWGLISSRRSEGLLRAHDTLAKLQRRSGFSYEEGWVGEELLSRGNSKCKGPEAERSLAFSENDSQFGWSPEREERGRG